MACSVAARCCSLMQQRSEDMRGVLTRKNRRYLRSKEEGLTTCFIFSPVRALVRKSACSILGYYFCWFIIPNAFHGLRNPCCFITLFAHVGASHSTPGRALEAYQAPVSRVGSHAFSLALLRFSTQFVQSLRTWQIFAMYFTSLTLTLLYAHG